MNEPHMVPWLFAADDFHALAEEVSHEQLVDFFEAWLHTPSKPTGTAGQRPGLQREAASRGAAPTGR